MALFKYYKLKEKLPKPDRLLSQSVPLSLILSANEEVRSEHYKVFIHEILDGTYIHLIL